MAVSSLDIRKPSSNHPDLVELAGYHAYLNIKERSQFEVNNTEYTVLNTRYEHRTGLDAMTVQNDITQEVTIVFVGTDAAGKYGNQDILTDVQLLSPIEPRQIKAARAYYKEMSEKYEISSITGNSLGGGLSLAVGVQNPHLNVLHRGFLRY
ncbi:hypothetical protein [Bacillus massilinigeriensis]|uniref:hypothetical protein n=1 Tax=Bacillus mediterraneensis TaxID=1805474 RepID=UPI0008F80E6C|nr:hypothetical protein [Bacillus mediterraneensis]